jgi:hypothetical protein
VITVRVRVHGGAARVAPELFLGDLHDLEVDTSSSSSTLMRERNPRVQSTSDKGIDNRAR